MRVVKNRERERGERTRRREIENGGISFADSDVNVTSSVASSLDQPRNEKEETANVRAYETMTDKQSRREKERDRHIQTEKREGEREEAVRKLHICRVKINLSASDLEHCSRCARGVMSGKMSEKRGNGVKTRTSS